MAGSESETADAATQHSGRERLQLLTLLAAGAFPVMARSIISPALPAMAEFFRNEPDADFWVKLLSTVPALFIAIGGPIAGIFMGKIGKKNVLLFSVLIASLAGGIGGLLNSLPALFITRGLHGLTVGAIMASSVTLIADYYHERRRASVMGNLAAWNGFSSVLVLVLGGVLADISWRTPFTLYLIGVFTVPAIFLYLYEPSHASIAAGQSEAEATSGIPVPKVILLYSLGFISLVAFTTIPVQLPFYFTDDVTATMVGLALSGFALFSAAAALLYGKAVSRFGYYSVFILAFALITSGFLILALSSSYSIIVPALMLSGSGFGILMPNFFTWTNAFTPPRSRGHVISGLVTSVSLATFLSPILTEPIVEGYGIAECFAGAAFATGTCTLFFILLSSKQKRERA